MYKSSRQEPENKNATLTTTTHPKIQRPAQEAGFFGGAWTKAAFSRTPTERSEQERRAGIEAVAGRAELKNKKHNKGQQMKQKIITIASIATLIIAALIVGGIDNDYEEQRSTERQGCQQVTTPDGTGFCR